jgi:uncharacterized protein (TIGR03086 family)
VDLIASLDQTFKHAHGVIANVEASQYGNVTPCEEWTVRELLDHMIGVVAGLGAAAAGSPPEGRAFELSSDPATQFQAAAAAALAGWQTPGAMDRVVDGGPGPMSGRVLAGINLLDTATHTWDLATATDQRGDLPPGVAEAALEVSRQIVTPELRPGRFGPELTPPSDADATERLVAFLGRKP